MHSGLVPAGRRSGAERGRIAVLAHTHPSVTKGGAEVAAYSLFRGLSALGIDAIFVAACPQLERARLSLGSAREFAAFLVAPSPHLDRAPLSLGSAGEFAVFYAPGFYEPFYHLSSPELSRS